MSKFNQKSTIVFTLMSLPPLLAGCDADEGTVSESDDDGVQEAMDGDPMHGKDDLIDPLDPSEKVFDSQALEPMPIDDGGGGGGADLPQPYPVPPPPDDTVVPGRRSLIETNKTVVQQFSMDEVLTAVIVNSGSAGTSAGLHDQLFESFKTKATGALGVQHCDDVKSFFSAAKINGFPIECPRAEGTLVGKLANWQAIAVVNRFDLAPTTGADCGEQRIIFSNTAVGRGFLIFEAKIPNPTPEVGIAACRPIAEFWASLAAVSSPSTRASKLKQAFLSGEPTLAAAGFSPFMKAQHFTELSGQIRSNNFGQPPWTLREHKLSVVLVNGVQRVSAVLSAAGNSSYGPTWDETKATHNSTTCRQAILDNLGMLLGGNVEELGLSLPKSCWSGESRDDTNQDYSLHLGNSPIFRQQLAAKIQALKPGSTLTMTQVANRARFASSCIGCHQQAVNLNIGGGLTTPGSLGFVHVSEQGSESCGDGTTCFPISPALKTVFLPKRLEVLNNFLNAGLNAIAEEDALPLPAGVSGASNSVARTLGGAVVGSH